MRAPDAVGIESYMSEDPSRIEYRLEPSEPRAHRVIVTCTVARPDPAGQAFSLPAWIPGSYVIRDFARNIQALRAEAGGTHVAVERRDKQTWVCAPCDGPLTVHYEVYALDPSVRAAYLDHRRGLFNGTSVFLRPHGADDRPCRVELVPPPADGGAWSVATTLTAEETDAAGFGTYHAADYAELIDHPVAMGPALERVEFDVAGVPHAFVLLGEAACDRDRLASDLAAVCRTQADFFGELPVRRYLFLAQLGGGGYGGLEHRDCSVLALPREALPAGDTERRGDAYLNLLGLCSHEYFHLWNVKRIRPRAVAESDLAAESHFEDLWAYEGVTSYCDDLALVRAGLLTPAAYLERVARAATRLERTPGRHRQSLAESSYDAWTKFYRPDANTPNAVVSYYLKGALVSLCLDLHLRAETDGAVDLGSVMRAAWHAHGRSGEPVPEHGLESLAEEVAGLDLSEFFARFVHGREDPPLADYLQPFGVRCERRAPSDPGEAAQSALGLRLEAADTTRVAHVLDGGAAQRAGLCPGDRLVALAGLTVSGGTLAARLRPYPAGVTLPLHVVRGEELLCLDLTVAPPPADTWHLAPDPGAGDAALARRRAWIGG